MKTRAESPGDEHSAPLGSSAGATAEVVGSGSTQGLPPAQPENARQGRPDRRRLGQDPGTAPYRRTPIQPTPFWTPGDRRRRRRAATCHRAQRDARRRGGRRPRARHVSRSRRNRGLGTSRNDEHVGPVPGKRSTEPRVSCRVCLHWPVPGHEHANVLVQRVPRIRLPDPMHHDSITGGCRSAWSCSDSAPAPAPAAAAASAVAAASVPATQSRFRSARRTPQAARYRSPGQPRQRWRGQAAGRAPVVPDALGRRAGWEQAAAGRRPGRGGCDRSSTGSSSCRARPDAYPAQPGNPIHSTPSPLTWEWYPEWTRPGLRSD